MKEIWKKIKGTDGRYEISNTGMVRSNNYLGHGVQAEISLQKDNRGYLRTRIIRGGQRVTIKIHREVAIAFIPNPLNKPEVNHKDGNKMNNNVDNLEWCTASENTKHAYRSGLKEKTREHCRKMGKSQVAILAKYREARKTPVIATNIETGEETLYSSQSEAENGTGAKQPNILKVLKGKRKSSNGFHFRYATQMRG